jgi:serine/threonine protein kinase
MGSTDFIGQTLDDKYSVERELGRGGMGTVYLATHLGTERPVAVKIIAPQFMKRAEFVERFRREARAAGRLRHPNVVDVTDFGLAETINGRVAYLVMEYLDGCTLGEILEEEKNLPVAWTLDILEQVCSAVQEAHTQGIIHRDLKPDNIWLEPNQRGGYTVKVLDFGIAKLEESMAVDAESVGLLSTARSQARPTHAGIEYDETVVEGGSPTLFTEASTIALAPEIGSEDKTALFSDLRTISSDSAVVGTRVISDELESGSPSTAPAITSTTDLTRVGAVLGTPLYMSPEQCRGDKLDARSDIYSIGVIAYQMLSGNTPFSGDFTDVMEAHRVEQPPDLEAKNVRRKLKKVILSTLEKDPDKRPQTAEALASELRSRSEGIFILLRRAGMIYTEHMPKFLMLSAFFHLPMIVLTICLIVVSFLRISDVIPSSTANLILGINAFALTVVTEFCAYLIIGTITWIVTQFLAVPLRPIRLRPALKEAGRKWKTFAGTGILKAVFLVLIAAVTCGIGFLVFSVLWMLVGPVVMMENARGMQALRRSKELVKRSVVTSAAAFLIMFLIPAISAGAISFAVKVTDKAFTNQVRNIKITGQSDGEAASEEAPIVEPSEKEKSININFGNNGAIKIGNLDEDMGKRVKNTVLESLLQILLLPIQIVVTSFTAIIVALLYLKTRQAGGETIQDLVTKLEDSEHPRKKWQERVRQRLIQSGRITSKS